MKHNSKTTAALSLAPVIGNLFSTPVRLKKVQQIVPDSANSLCQFGKNRTLKHLLYATKNALIPYKDHIEACCATVTIGGIFLGLIVIFLTQLAEYGW